MLIFDCETDGLLPEVSKIHCLVIKDTETGDVSSYTGLDIPTGLRRLQAGVTICGHNVIKYDLPVIKKLYPWFSYESHFVLDTLVLARLLRTNIKDTDVKLMASEKLPKKYYGSHSLASWGYRLGNYKGDYTGGWETYSQEMLDYCIQDVEVTHTLYNFLLKDDVPERAIVLEHQIACLMAKQERNGFVFNEQGAAQLYTVLAKRRGELEDDLRNYFGSWVVQLPDFIPARDNKTLKYLKGVPVPRSKTILFNPSSRDHIANRLINLYGWKPSEFTASGKAQVDEVILSKLTFPPCELITEYLLVAKRISQLAEGDQAWMKLSKKGKIHGSVNTNGAVTGRATHAYPNISQVPSGGSAYGHECRELFTVPKGWRLVGADASGLELRCLAHFMAKYDGGAYGEVLLTGDIHTENQKAAGLSTRSQAKTFIYAFLYGAGDAKIGTIVNGDAVAGRKLKKKFLRSLPALGRLSEAVKKAADRGYLTGLDGRRLHVRSSHSALNTLLQSAGALVCKKWLVILEETLGTEGLSHGWDKDYTFCAWSHDEVQIACRNQEIAEVVAKIATDCVPLAGDYFNFRCPLAGESKIGDTWRDTH
jgi:DNA polymerase I-like protein with 3'-5' exonuclease and polymerase domains